MTESDKAVMQQALRALEAAIDYTDNEAFSTSATRECAAAISELRYAIAQQKNVTPIAYAAQIIKNGKWAYIWHELDDVEGWISRFNDSTPYRLVPLYAAAIAQPEQPTFDAKDSEIERLRKVLDHNILERAKLVNYIAQQEQRAPAITAYMTRHDDGDMLFFNKEEARRYCDDDSEPEPLVSLSAIAQPVQTVRVQLLTYASVEQQRYMLGCITQATGILFETIGGVK